MEVPPVVTPHHEALGLTRGSFSSTAATPGPAWHHGEPPKSQEEAMVFQPPFWLRYSSLRVTMDRVCCTPVATSMRGTCFHKLHRTCIFSDPSFAKEYLVSTWQP